MGRVGSVAINRALKNVGVDTLHAHYLANGGEHYKRLLAGDDLIKAATYDIVTLVRDPIARNLSEYFRRMSPKVEYDYQWLYKKFMKDFNHIWPLVWFDLEFLPFTGLDLLYWGFPIEHTDTFQTAIGRNVLVLRTDKLNQKSTSEALSEFTGKEIAEIPVANNISERPGLDVIYDAFLSQVCFPEPFVEFFYNSAYSIVFFTAKERERFMKRWTCQ